VYSLVIQKTQSANLNESGFWREFSLNRFAVIALVLASAFVVQAEPPDAKTETGNEIFARYQEAIRRQNDVRKDLAMDVTMEATIPKLKKHGRMNALRRISSLGKITYKILGFSGDDTVKKEVMARYMTAEVDAAQSKRDQIGITPENYEFKYKGQQEKETRLVHVFELKPRHKRLGLFKGELWLDPTSFLPIREFGRLVKNPSVFIKKMEFVRKYDIRDGVAYLVQLDSRTDTRIVGRADLHIDYGNFQLQDAGEEPVEEARGASLVTAH
jgi:hypothetical protein